MDALTARVLEGHREVCKDPNLKLEDILNNEDKCMHDDVLNHVRGMIVFSLRDACHSTGG